MILINNLHEINYQSLTLHRGESVFLVTTLAMTTSSAEVRRYIQSTFESASAILAVTQLIRYGKFVLVGSSF